MINLVWHKEEEEGEEAWVADYNNVKAIVYAVWGGGYKWAVLSLDPISGLYRHFIDGGEMELSLEYAKNAAEKELRGFVGCLQKVYNKAERGSLMRSRGDPHMVWTQTLLGVEGDDMLTNDEVVKNVAFVKCHFCSGNHLLWAGREVPMYWCGHVLKKLIKGDEVEYGEG